MSRLSIYFALVALAVAQPPTEIDNSKGLCNISYCVCTQAIHPAWTSINCTVPRDKEISILNLDLPSSVMELSISGAETVLVGMGALNGVFDIRRIHISDSKFVVFRQFAAVELSVLNLALDVARCNYVRFEKQSFQNLRGPMSVTIADCQVVSVEGDTFSWLLNMEISNVSELSLGSGSFTLDPTAANVGDHGPGMSVDLKNTTVAEFAKSTFGSSAARVYFEGVDIHAIRTGAFSANTYNIVLAINCSIHLIEEDAFSENSLINYLNLDSCNIQQLESGAMRSAIANININHTRFDHVETGAINTTVASIKIVNSEFHSFMEKGFELSSWNILQMENNSFDDLPANAIAAPAATIHKLIFNNNEIETMHPESLSFIGKAATREIEYLNNYYGQSCHCNISHWLAKALGVDSSAEYDSHSFCTVNEVLARCFNVPDQNMMVKKFLSEVCTKSPSIKCEELKLKTDGAIEIKNTRFPHKHKDDELSARNKKVIGIVIVSCLGFLVVAILFSLYKWWRRGRGGCTSIKTIFVSLNTTCVSMCGRVCPCGSNVGIDNARSISQLSVNEYSERHRLNESRVDIVQESSFQDTVAIPTDEKFTQTLPEELTKELLDNLKERLDNPDNYVEAREMIEHLYELTKITDEAPQLTAVGATNAEENIYELPYQSTTRRVSPYNKQMISIGTRVPSLDKLMPLSPYYRQTALSHEYFEPRDLAVHLYAEIANNERDKITVLGAIPDVIAEQAIPRGPYLRAILAPNNSPSSSPSKSSTSISNSPLHVSTIKSSSSDSSAKMLNRPLPEKPQGMRVCTNSGEGSSLRLG